MNMPPQHYGHGPTPGGPHPGHAPPAAGYGVPPYGYAAPPPQYEFTPAQNQIVSDVAGAARGLGVVHYIQAGLNLLGTNFIAAGIAFAIGYQYHQGGTVMQRVVDTQGNDIGNLMEALDKLAGAFMIRLVLALIGAVIFALVLLVMGGVIVAALTEAANQGHL